MKWLSCLERQQRFGVHVSALYGSGAKPKGSKYANGTYFGAFGLFGAPGIGLRG